MFSSHGYFLAFLNNYFVFCIIPVMFGFIYRMWIAILDLDYGLRPFVQLLFFCGYKIRYCHCGRRMSTLTCVFHSICINVAVLIAILRTDVMSVLTFDDVMTNYVRIVSSLKLGSDIRIKVMTQSCLLLLLTILQSSAMPLHLLMVL